MTNEDNGNGLDKILEKADELIAELAIDDYKTFSIFLELYETSFLQRIQEALFKKEYNGEISIVKQSNLTNTNSGANSAPPLIYPDDFNGAPQSSNKKYPDSQLFQYRIINKEGFASLLELVVKNPSEKNIVKLKLIGKMDPTKLPEMGGLHHE